MYCTVLYRTVEMCWKSSHRIARNKSERYSLFSPILLHCRYCSRKCCASAPIYAHIKSLRRLTYIQTHNLKSIRFAGSQLNHLTSLNRIIYAYNMQYLLFKMCTFFNFYVFQQTKTLYQKLYYDKYFVEH